MARKKTSAQQSSFITREIPEMPEGYYSSDPNPNLRRFVEEHATPYDPQTDDYNVPPFDQPITTTKATAIYNMHTYWSKKPHDAIRQYIRHYTRPGDIVLDPFCGSGGTALAALMEGRAAIAIDLSPAATFITKNYCTPVDVDALQRAFDELEAKVKPEMDWLYETRCDRCDGRATTGYVVYSYVFQCPRCLERVPLVDCVEVQGQTAHGRTKTISACPYCYAQGHTEEISSRNSQRFDPIPVMVRYSCEEGCQPRRSERYHNDSDPKKRLFFEQYDLGKLREIEAGNIPYWVTPAEFPKDFARWHSDLRLMGISRVADLYTKRNLWALALVRDKLMKLCEPSAYSPAAPIWAAVSTVSLTGSRMLRETKRAIQAGTYYIPPISREITIWNGIQYNMFQISKGLTELGEVAADPWDVCVSTQSACDLSSIETNSIGYIFTDPPYAGKVQYGELNFVWEAWLGFSTDWHSGEIIVNETRGKTDDDWKRMMHQAMSECHRVLKPGRWLSLCYHDTSEGTWQLVQDLMAEVGFIPENVESALYIDTGQKSFNQLMAEKVTKRDLVINFRKPRPDELATQLTLDFDRDQATFADKARLILREALDAHPGASADRLYDELVSRMVRRGEFERHNFDELLCSVAEESPPGSGRWYLLETADQVDEAESAKEAAAAARLEAYIHRVSSEKPGVSGVHYSDLFEEYLPVQDKPRRLLADWIPEYFFRTPEGTWRPPADDDERDQKEALRTGGTLRRIKRFARALNEGVPPHERDHPANVATAADWMRQCRRAGLYEIGRALYEKGGFDFHELVEEGQLEVEQDYQICVRRS